LPRLSEGPNAKNYLHQNLDMCSSPATKNPAIKIKTSVGITI